MFEEYSHLPKTPKEAKAAGSKLYFTGTPCPKGHISPRRVCNRGCNLCHTIGRRVDATSEATRLKIRNSIRLYRGTEQGKAAYRSADAARRASKKKATPSWCDRDLIREFYLTCPPGHHVDHIIPLKHEAVCGLHVLENLQHLPARDNISKSNRLIPITLEHTVCPITTSGTRKPP